MTYTISEIADKMGVSIHTLRFYDKEGLLPFVDRINGRRVFKDEDFPWLRVIRCLKNSGMPIHEIRAYIELCGKGDESLLARQAIIQRQKASLEEQIRFLQCNLKELEYKAWYYEKAVAAGTESVHMGQPCNPSMDPEAIPDDEREENRDEH